MIPFSIVLAEEQARWKEFRRALRVEDQRRFDELFEFARRNIQAAVQGAAPDPLESLLLLMLIELLKRVERLEASRSLSEEPDQLTLFAPYEDP